MSSQLVEILLCIVVLVKLAIMLVIQVEALSQSKGVREDIIKVADRLHLNISQLEQSLAEVSLSIKTQSIDTDS